MSGATLSRVSGTPPMPSMSLMVQFGVPKATTLWLVPAAKISQRRVIVLCCVNWT